MLARVLYQDPFSPLLKNSPAITTITLEQWKYIEEVLDAACSDSQFAKKAMSAISYILTGGNTVGSEVTSLTPSSVVIGAPSFTLHVIGKNFQPDSKIIFAGQEEPTTHVSATELTTGVNMDLWLGADTVPVSVQDANGLSSPPAMFTFSAAGTQAASTKSTGKQEPIKPLPHEEKK